MAKPDRLTQIKEMADKGYSSKQIAHEIGIRDDRVRQMPHLMNRSVGSLRDAGLSIPAIAAATGLGYGTVQRAGYGTVQRAGYGTVQRALTAPCPNGQGEEEPIAVEEDWWR